MGEACVKYGRGGGGEKGNVCRVLVGKTKRRRPLGRPRMGWRILILSDSDGGQLADSCKQKNETSGSIKWREFLE
jgi:hypothetical protein